MQNIVTVDFPMKAVGVYADYVFLDSVTIDLVKDVLPDNVKNEKINYIVWDIDQPLQTAFNLADGGAILFEANEENYNKWVKPYVDLWQAEKDRIEQEQQQQQEEYNKFENRQARALTQLNDDFETAKERAHIVSSLGFTADANQTANENITGLLVTIGDTEKVQFCDYHNIFRELTKADLQVLQTEIIANAQNLYQQKWVYRTQIENCTNNEGLDAVLEAINFTYMDFTPSDTGDGGQAAEQA